MDKRIRYGWKNVMLLTVAAAPLWAQAPTVAIESPGPGATVSGVFPVTGWAIDNVVNIGTPISTVQVFVDGTRVGNAAYGASRPDVCIVYPGRPNCPSVGYAFYIDSSTLTPGAHTIMVSAVDTDPTPDTGTSSVQVTVAGSGGPSPTPTVTSVIESPTTNASLSGSFTVSGWAIDGLNGTNINTVQVAIDGVAAGNATYGGVRTDVCSVYPGRPGCPNVGYTLTLNTANYTLGSHVITITASDSDNPPDSNATSVTVNFTAGPSVNIDSPTPGTVVTGIVNVTGWALDSATAIGTAVNNVQMMVDGVPVGMATYGALRADVCTTYPGRPGCPNVGFNFMLDTRTLTPGAHTITATATDSDLSPDSGSFTVNIQVPQGPTVTIESPTPGASVSGPVTLSGWAIDNVDNVGTAISKVQVSVDGVVNGTANYGTIRPDICALYPGRPGCPFVGFTYALNTNGLTAGSHTVTVAATDTDTTPDTGSASVTINVIQVPVFNLDAPSSGSTVSGVIVVSGWASPPAGSVMNAVKVFVDGVQRGLAYYGLARPDICATYPGLNNCPTIGWSYNLNTTGLPNGQHTIQVTAGTEDSAPPVGMGSTTVTVAN